MKLIHYLSISVFCVGISSTEKVLPTNYAEFDDTEQPNPVVQAKMSRDFPQTSYEFATQEQTANYIRVKTPIPDLDELTVCGWYTRYTTSWDVWISYATAHHHNDFVFGNSVSKIEIWLLGSPVEGHLTFPTHKEHHVCVTTFTRTGYSYIFVNGQIEDVLHGSNVGVLSGGGVMILGLDQDVMGGGFQAGESAQGKLSNFMLWKRALTFEEIAQMSLDRCHCPSDYYITLQHSEVELEGGATALVPHSCAP